MMMTTTETLTAYANLFNLCFYSGLIIFGLIAVGIYFIIKTNDKKKAVAEAKRQYNVTVHEIIRHNSGR